MTRKNKAPGQTVSRPVPPATPDQIWPLYGLVAAYCVLALLLIARVPIGSAPDEQAHLLFVQHLASFHSLPVFKAQGANYPGYEFHQPPFYYFVCALMWNVAGPGAQDYLCRVVAMLFGAGTLVFLWHAVRHLFPARRQMPLLATGVAALLPMHIAVGASAANDSAAGFWCVAMLWCLARGVRQWNWRGSLLLGVFVGLGVLSKLTAVGIALPALLGACSLAAAGAAPDGRQVKFAALRTICLVGGTALLLCGWWLWRNASLYGDVLASHIFLNAFKSSPSPSQFLDAGVSVATYLRALLLVTFCTGWGLFGGPNSAIAALAPFGGSSPPVPFILLPVILSLAAAHIAVFLGLGRSVADWKSQEPRVRMVLAWWVTGALLVLVLWIRFNLSFFQAQARYLHPALAPCALLAAWAWWQLFYAEGARPRYARLATGILALVMVGLTLYNAFVWRTLV